MKNLQRENSILRKKLTKQYSFHDIISKSPAMLGIFDLVRDVASLRSTVLIRGESGTGKELIARAVHFSGDRTGKPFVGVSCAALAETLLESELFGHEKGSFTGAAAQRKGKFEMAHGGTIFLDEIGDISPKLQMDLLRVLQERTFYRVGGSEEIEVDVRVIAATNVDLERAVREGKFRDDLYYRLNVISINIPPLRERREDIPLLADTFIERLSHELGKEITGIIRRCVAPPDELRLAGQRTGTRERDRTCHGDRKVEAADRGGLCVCRSRHGRYAPQEWTVPPDMTLEEAENRIITATLAAYPGEHHRSGRDPRYRPLNAVRPVEEVQHPPPLRNEF